MKQSGRILLIASGKGGAGKSTFTVNCGTALAQRGHKVLLVDADIGLRSLDLMLAVSDRVVFDIGDVLEGRCEPGKAIIVTDCHNLHLLPASQNICEDMKDSAIISKLYMGLAEYYDYVFIDSPAGIGETVTAPASAADCTIVVATADSVCIRDAEHLSQVLRARGAKDLRLVLNRIEPKLIRKKVMPDLDSAIDGATIQLLGVIPEDKHVFMAAAVGKPVTVLRRGAGQAFRNIAARLDGDNVPLMRL
jgi:septum site-determining protein MinD